MKHFSKLYTFTFAACIGYIFVDTPAIAQPDVQVKIEPLNKLSGSNPFPYTDLPAVYYNASMEIKFDAHPDKKWSGLKLGINVASLFGQDGKASISLKESDFTTQPGSDNLVDKHGSSTSGSATLNLVLDEINKQITFTTGTVTSRTTGQCPVIMGLQPPNDCGIISGTTEFSLTIQESIQFGSPTLSLGGNAKSEAAEPAIDALAAPAPLPALGIFSAYRFSRKLRKSLRARRAHIYYSL